MREYSRCALDFLRSDSPRVCARLEGGLRQFPLASKSAGGELPLMKRNDLLHVDAFPTRPVFGDMILRCFTNVNPEQPREWLTSDPFAELASREAVEGGTGTLCRSARFADLQTAPRSVTRTLQRAGLPVVDRSPYDAFMLHFHDWLKANRDYQDNCPKYRFDLPPGSTWLVFTDVVPHAVLAGRLALEQTVIVSRGSLANPANAPASILERLAGRSLTV